MKLNQPRKWLKRFAAGAMSLGSISTEAHSTLAVAMNRTMVGVRILGRWRRGK